MKIILVRHGDTQRGENGVYGDTAPLTELGHEQARKTGDLLSTMPITHVISSDARRALQTAEPLSGALRLDPVVIPELKEIDIGQAADGVTPFEYLDPVNFVLDCSHAGGETWDSFRTRVLNGLDILAETIGPGSTAAVFTHGGVKSVAMDHYAGREISRSMMTLFANGSISVVEKNGSDFVVHSVNDAAHLE